MQPQQMTTGMAPTQVQIQQPQQQQNNGQSSYLVCAKKAMFGLGVTQIILGSLVILFGVVSIVLKCYIYEGGTPIWCGALFLVTGVLGVLTSRKSKGFTIAYLVLSIITAVFAGAVLLTVESIAVANEYYNYNDYHNSYYWSNCYNWDTHRYDSECLKRVRDRTGIDGTLIFLSILVGILSIISSSFGCVALCSSRKSTTGAIMYYVSSQPGGVPMQAPVAGAQQGQVVILPYGAQVVGAGGQPMQPMAYYPTAQPGYANQPLVVQPQQMQGPPQQQRPPQMYQPLVPQQQQQQPPQAYQPLGTQQQSQAAGGQDSAVPPSYSSIDVRADSNTSSTGQTMKLPLISDS